MNDVWIGKTKLLDSFDAIVEWYFMSVSWETPDVPQSQKVLDRQRPIQIKMTVQNGNHSGVIINNLYNFEERRLNLDDYDISLCNRYVDKKHFMFSLNSEKIF